MVFSRGVVRDWHPNKVIVKRPTTEGEIAQLVAVEDVGSNPTQMNHSLFNPKLF